MEPFMLKMYLQRLHEIYFWLVIKPVGEHDPHEIQDEWLDWLLAAEFNVMSKHSS